MLTPTELGDRIRERRRELGLTQETLAECAGVSTETVGRLEQGVGTPTLDTIYKIAKALGTTGSALIADRVDEEVNELVNNLPEHEQEIARVMLGALSAHMRDS